MTNEWPKTSWAFMVVITTLAGWLWIIRPENMWNWIAAIVCLPAILLLMTALRRAKGRGPMSAEGWRKISRSFAGGSLIIILALGAALVDFYTASAGEAADWSTRAGRIIPGGILVVIANAIPKIAVKNPRYGALLRFNAWALVLGGVGYAACWAILPLDNAREPAMAFMMTGVALVILRTAWFRFGGKTGRD